MYHMLTRILETDSYKKHSAIEKCEKFYENYLQPGIEAQIESAEVKILRRNDTSQSCGAMSEGSCSQTWVNSIKYCGELLKMLNYLNPNFWSRREANGQVLQLSKSASRCLRLFRKN